MINDVLPKLKGVRRTSSGWTARCPAHDDNRNSLSVSLGADERLLLRCHAGCPFEAIRDALGTAAADVSGRRRLVAAYDYRDEGGALLYQSLRFEPKDFRQRRPDGSGGWTYKLNGARRVPYRLPELLAAPPSETVFIVEGEKDADRLTSLGLVATTNAGGAGKWRDEFGEALRGRRVVIIPDNDEPGREHAARVARSLRGVAADVRVLELPGLQQKGDVSDWLDSGGVVDELLVLAEAAPACAGGDGPPPQAGPGLQLVRMADVAPETVGWLWHPYIPFGKLTILEGDPGLGKSWLTCALAAAVSRGRGLPGCGPFDPGNVLMLSAEDGLGDTLRPRLDAVGADVEKVYAINSPLTLDTVGLLQLEELIIGLRPSLVIIDPLFAYTGGKVDIHRANECRAISAPLAAAAERHGCALVAVRHLGKSRGGGHALNAGIGSIDFTAAARSVLLVGQDPDDATRRALVQTKNNLAPHGGAVGYMLEEGRFYWTGESTLTAGRILSLPSDEEERGARVEAAEFLRAALAEGPRPARDVKAEARQAGIPDITLRRAKDRLGVRAEKEGGRLGERAQRWLWSLPGAAEGAHSDPEDAQEKRDEHLLASGGDKGTYGNNLAEDAHSPLFEHLLDADEHLLQAEAPTGQPAEGREIYEL